jgi:predicted RNase H-like nuclease
LNRDFRRFNAGCHAANPGRPFASKVIAFSRALESLGFMYGTSMEAWQTGRFQIEVHPHAAIVSLFRLERIVKYKRGTRDQRAKELRLLRGLALSLLSFLDPALTMRLAYVGACWWTWTTQRNRLCGDEKNGFIVVPQGPLAR